MWSEDQGLSKDLPGLWYQIRTSEVARFTDWAATVFLVSLVLQVAIVELSSPYHLNLCIKSPL